MVSQGPEESLLFCIVGETEEQFEDGMPKNHSKRCFGDIMVREFQHDMLADSDLCVDAIYLGGKQKNLSAEVLSKLFSVGNAGGFRVVVRSGKVVYAVLFSSGDDKDWPDNLDRETGIYTYYGDNKTPGRDLHDTKKGGNTYLRSWFDSLHMGHRERIPPLFLFEKVSGRNMRYLGLAVPGSESLEQTEDLVALWKTKDEQRFQNYRAKLTILDVPVVHRGWIKDLENQVIDSNHAPKPFDAWVKKGNYLPLKSQRSTVVRTKSQQLPEDSNGRIIIQKIHAHFPERRAILFESCAARIFEMIEPENVVEIDVTRPSRDGGRDAIGKYRIGVEPSYLISEFAMEAKCWALDKGCGVKATNRLISRLRHRQFGVFITTSYVAQQAYSEIVEDRHPVLIISARDIIQVLRKNGLSSAEKVDAWLQSNWPL